MNDFTPMTLEYNDYPSIRDKGQLKTELRWSLHNLVAHPVSEVCFWLGFLAPRAREFGDWFHDVTVPVHESGTGRG